MAVEQVALTLTPAQALALEDSYDRALIAHFTGWARNPISGEGIRYFPAFDDDVLSTLSRRGLVGVEQRGGVASPLVWITDEGYGVIQDIVEEGGFDAHVAALRAA